MKKKSGHWSHLEDQRCLQAVRFVASNHEKRSFSKLNQFKLPIGFNWTDVARFVGTRTAKQCRERYLNQLAPDINRKPWSSDEDDILKEFFPIYGSKWQQYTVHLHKRTENSIKMRWRALERRRKRHLEKEAKVKQALVKAESTLTNIAKESSFQLPPNFDINDIWNKDETVEFSDGDLNSMLEIIH